MRIFNLISKEFHKNGYIKYRLPSFKSELYLIKWNPRNQTDIHGHDGKNCNFIILNGKLFETRYNHENTILKSNQLKIYNINFINDKIGKHKICNLDHKKTIWSLHRYL
tara:strand:- start:13 stop:339 length:327 start_codon:yes stop_codon:yes gene_type:complete